MPCLEELGVYVEFGGTGVGREVLGLHFLELEWTGVGGTRLRIENIRKTSP